MKTNNTTTKKQAPSGERGQRVSTTIKRFGTLLSAISSHYGGKSRGVSELLENFYNSVRARAKARGNDEAADHFKQVYLIAVKIAVGRTFKPLMFTKSDKKDGTPTVLKPLVPLLISESEEQKRIGLSIAKVYLDLHSKRSPNMDSITDPYEGRIDMEGWSKYLDSIFLPSLQMTEWNPTHYHITTKRGPNGLALVDCDKDAVALCDYFPEHLDMIGSFRSPILKDHIKSVAQQVKSSRRELPLLISRLSIIREGGCKNRVIALGDYFTQEALKETHHFLFKWLRKQPEDGTFRQDNTAKLVRTALNEGRPVFCFDLTSATDRLPLNIQEEVMSRFIGKEKANLWRHLLTDRSFSFEGKEYNYNTGQPMGFYTSWASLAVTHHLIVRYCARLERVSSFKKYVIIGDDVSIFDEKIAKRYRKFMEDAKVPISLAKSVITRPSDPGIKYGEIAKRLITSKSEITPIPLPLIKYWAGAPHREGLLLRLTLESIGIGFDPALYRTLSLVLFPGESKNSKERRERFLVSTQSPPDLIGQARNHVARNGVTEGIWGQYHKNDIVMALWTDLTKVGLKRSRDHLSPPGMFDFFKTGKLTIPKDEFPPHVKSYKCTVVKEGGGPMRLSPNLDDPLSNMGFHPAWIVVTRFNREVTRAAADFMKMKPTISTVFSWMNQWLRTFLPEFNLPARLSRKKIQARMTTDLLYRVYKTLKRGLWKR